MVTAKPRRLPSGRISWRVQFRAAGKVTSESFTPRDDSAKEAERAQKEANRFASLVERVGGDAAMAVRDARDEPGRDIPTLEDWTSTYLDPSSGQLSGVTEATRHGYRAIAQRSFLQVLGPMPLDAITKQSVAKWIVWQEAQASQHRPGQLVAAKTMRNYHAVLSSVLAAAVDAELISGNPARGARLTRGYREGVTFLTVEEFNRLHDLMPEYYRPVASWLVWTGMRWGEATALTWGDLDTSGAFPTVRITKAWKKGPGAEPVLGPPKTRRSVRTIAVLPDVIRELGEPGRPDELIFRGSRDGGRLRIERFHKAAWYPAVAAANVEAADASHPRPLGKRPRVHDLRHSHASWLIADGAPLTYIQARLGHENITTTSDTYGHLLPDANLQLLQVLHARRERSQPRTELAALAELVEVEGALLPAVESEVHPRSGSSTIGLDG